MDNSFILKQAVNILYENPEIFSVSDYIIKGLKQEKLEIGWATHILENYIGLRFIVDEKVNSYYKLMFDYTDANNVILKAILFEYFKKFPTKEDKIKFDNLFK